MDATFRGCYPSNEKRFVRNKKNSYRMKVFFKVMRNIFAVIGVVLTIALVTFIIAIKGRYSVSINPTMKSSEHYIGILKASDRIAGIP